MQFADEEHARDVADFFLDELLRNGTTTAAVFATVHPHSADTLFAAAAARNIVPVTLELGGKYTIAAFVMVAVLWLTRPFWDKIPLPFMFLIHLERLLYSRAGAEALPFDVVVRAVRK